AWAGRASPLLQGVVLAGALLFLGQQVRSEERRVGEECRSRGAPYHLKKKNGSEDSDSQLLLRTGFVGRLVSADELGERSLRPFFFSSRRRPTRFKCDWSSDVCSSD